jgi:hypothetical protein
MPQAAVLIDWENLKSSLNESLRALPDIVTLKKVVRQFGTLRLSRAYANWSDPWHDGDSHRLAQQGIDPIHVQTREGTGDRPLKNSADLRLACDGVELLATHPTLETLVHLVDKLKAHGKTVIVIAVKQSLSSVLRVACDEAVHYDDLVRGLRAVGVGADVHEALTLFGQALTGLHESGRDTSLPAVKAEMVQRLGSFNEESLGIPTFRHLAFLAEANGHALVDARSEPFRAFPVGTSGTGLFAADVWRHLVSSMEPDRDYPSGELKAALQRNGVPADKASALFEGCGSSGAAAKVRRNSELQDPGAPSDTCVSRPMAPTRS